jgi:hypothetical protein
LTLTTFQSYPERPYHQLLCRNSHSVIIHWMCWLKWRVEMWLKSAQITSFELWLVVRTALHPSFYEHFQEKFQEETRWSNLISR